MEIYKFKDTIDGNYCFIIASNKTESEKVLQNLTAIPFDFIESKAIEDVNLPIIMYNKILPF